MSHAQKICKVHAYFEVNARNILETLVYAWFFEPCCKPRKRRVREDRALLWVEGSHGQSSHRVIVLTQV